MTENRKNNKNILFTFINSLNNLDSKNKEINELLTDNKEHFGCWLKFPE